MRPYSDARRARERLSRRGQRMRRAFTLIELLVVIAIIAILAAILFPVFAQAKVSAKKTAAVSNQHQIGLAILQYMADYDDTYPRNDDCTAGSSLNSTLNSKPFNPTGPGCTGPYFYRANHYSWQKWVMPYTKNVQVFEHPGRTKFDTKNGAGYRQWSDNGQIVGGFALNLSITGALNTYLRPPGSYGMRRNSWLGGTQSALPNPSGAMLLLEFGSPEVNFAPVAIKDGDNQSEQTAFPPAFREIWARHFYTWTKCSGVKNADNEITKTIDQRNVFGNGITIGFADGSSKFLQAGAFLARTPSYKEYGNPTSVQCGFDNGVVLYSGNLNTNIDYPFWGLGGQ